MENIYNFTLIEIVAFALILLRMLAFVMVWPVFGTNLVPMPVKILLGLSLTFILYPLVGFQKLPKEPNLEILLTLATRELAIGLTLGFFSRLFFFAIGIAGQIISVSLGLSTAQLFNPAINEGTAAIEQFHLILATLLFLGIQGHQMLLSVLVRSYDYAPLTTSWFSVAAFGSLGQIIQEVMLTGVKLSAPLLIAILFLNLAMAVVGRAVPQMNVLVTSMPVNILVGIVVLFVTIPVMIWQMDGLTHDALGQLFQLMKSF
jgi:flagellar biosynthetic protein FliR